MSEQQLSALLARLKEEKNLREKFQVAADLDSALSLAKEAGFDVNEAVWLRHHTHRNLDFSDDELEALAGGAESGRLSCCPCR
jgi:predicted ribosomally synthesized peptide with nif11-like leader